MRITYFALRRIQVGDDWREPGDLVPEAASWPFLSGYVADGRIAPVLVATLPKESQKVLAEWEADQQAAAVPEEQPVEPEPQTDPDTERPDPETPDHEPGEAQPHPDTSKQRATSRKGAA